MVFFPSNRLAKYLLKKNFSFHLAQVFLNLYAHNAFSQTIFLDPHLNTIKKGDSVFYDKKVRKLTDVAEVDKSVVLHQEAIFDDNKGMLLPEVTIIHSQKKIYFYGKHQPLHQLLRGQTDLAIKLKKQFPQLKVIGYTTVYKLTFTRDYLVKKHLYNNGHHLKNVFAKVNSYKSIWQPDKTVRYKKDQDPQWHAGSIKQIFSNGMASLAIRWYSSTPPLICLDSPDVVAEGLW